VCVCAFVTLGSSDLDSSSTQPFYIAGNTENEIHSQQVLSFDPSVTDRYPTSNPVTRFILQVHIITKLDMTCKKDRERLHALYKMFKGCVDDEVKTQSGYYQKNREEVLAGNVTSGDAPHLDHKEIEKGRELQKYFLAQFHDKDSLVDCNKSSAQVDKHGNLDKVAYLEHQRKARKTDSTPLLEDDGKGEGTGRLPDRDKVMIVDDIRSEADFPRLAQDIKRYMNMPNGPSVIVAAMYLCNPASQESVFKLEELAQFDVLSNFRHTSLNDDNYHQGSKSTKYNNYAIACTLLMKGAIKAVLDGKLYFNHYMPSDLKDRLRLMFPELKKSKYWRREATNAIERRRTQQARHRDAKRQKTA